MRPLTLRSNCRTCNRKRAEGERFSWSGQCPSCGTERMVENHAAMVTHRGPAFDHWRARCLAAFGVTVDEARDEAPGGPVAGQLDGAHEQG